MVVACPDCDVVYRPEATPLGVAQDDCPNCGYTGGPEVDPDELTQEQKEATQRYVFDMADHETVDHAVEAHSTSFMRAMAMADPDPGTMQMLESSFQSTLSSVACAVYARTLGMDPWALAFEGDERAHIMEEVAQDFSEKGYDVKFSWSNDSPYAQGTAVPKREVVERELKQFRQEEHPTPMHEALADHICNGGAKLLQLLALQPEGVPPEGRATVAKTLHELLTGRRQILLALGADSYRGMAEILEEFQVPHYRDVEEVDGEKVRFIVPEQDGEYLERIRAALEHHGPHRN